MLSLAFHRSSNFIKKSACVSPELRCNAKKYLYSSGETRMDSLFERVRDIIRLSFLSFTILYEQNDCHGGLIKCNS